jgi:sugar lactone lactonase YvrE
MGNPEGIAVDKSGRLYAADYAGQIVRFSLDGPTLTREVFAEAGGYPIGMGFDDRNGDLWLANFPLGLQRVDPAGNVTLEVQRADNLPVAFADDVVVANGKVYFTDVSTRFNLHNFSDTAPFVLWEFLEGRPNGRVLMYDPESKQVNTIVEQAFFPSGIAVANNEQALLFVEVSAHRLMRYWIGGERRGSREVLAANLPGVPDDVHVDGQGRIWVSLVSPRDQLLDHWIQPYPLVKTLLARLPDSLLRKMELPAGPGSILLINDAGEVQCQFHITPTTSVANIVVRDKQIFVGVLIGDSPGIMDFPSDAECLSEQASASPLRQ